MNHKIVISGLVFLTRCCVDLRGNGKNVEIFPDLSGSAPVDPTSTKDRPPEGSLFDHNFSAEELGSGIFVGGLASLRL